MTTTDGVGKTSGVYNNTQTNNTQEAEKNKKPVLFEAKEVDETSLKGKSLKELGDMLAEAISEGEDIEALISTIKELIKDKQGEIDEQNKNKTNLEIKIKQEEDRLKSLNELLKSTQTQLEDDYNRRLADAETKARSKYDKEQDGDWDKFLAGYTAEVKQSESILSKIDNVSKQIQASNETLSALRMDHESVVEFITTLNTEMATLVSNRNMMETQKDINTEKQNTINAAIAAEQTKQEEQGKAKEAEGGATT